ncbi:hypothetical protein CL176_10650 [Suicoccus acidiformans]|uniref:Sodium:glutamate symporter n=1 Tax=Suicoccus acidiformans TaxID=2036206 RepID=A0A347WMV7_9LACT|nr:sodium/glutamate symporter [Suicoccus acidiformans]AXY26414.1 hypothetical protein CL176_10650 [Suicoccus acidiformans]
MTIEFDLLATTAIGCVIALIGRYFNRHIRVLREWAIPAPVFSGLLFAILAFLLNSTVGLSFKWDKTLSDFLMNIFFTCMGFSFSLKNLREGRLYIVPTLSQLLPSSLSKALLGLVSPIYST